jgi:low temperature requirement protein LtrA
MPGSGEQSETTSLSDHKHRDYEAERNQGEFMKFYRNPVIRQYRHKGLLWRASETAEVSSYELFFDLLYVGILAVTGDAAVEAANAEGFAQFAVSFIMAWKIWSDLSTALSWIVMDDIVRRISILFIMIIILGLSTNMAGFYHDTYTPLVAFFIAGRWYFGLYFFWMGYLIPMVRNSMISTGIMSIVPGFLWIGSIYIEQPQRQAIIWVALFIDLMGPAMLMFFQTGIAIPSPKLKAKLNKMFEFSPGNNIEYRIERTNAFVALVFGYSIVNIIYSSSTAFGINAFFGKAVLGLIQTFIFNWLYFELDTFNMHAHAIRRSVISGSCSRFHSNS